MSGEVDNLIKQITNLIKVAETTSVIKTTDFLDPGQQASISRVLKAGQINDVFFYGGCESSERKVLIIHPGYNKPDITDMPIKSIEITGNQKYFMPTHRDIMGSILGIGLERDKLGDIIVKNNRALVFIKEEIYKFLFDNLDKVGNQRIKINESQDNSLYFDIKESLFSIITVPSLRIDAILSKGFTLSRKRHQI